MEKAWLLQNQISIALCIISLKEESSKGGLALKYKGRLSFHVPDCNTVWNALCLPKNKGGVMLHISCAIIPNRTQSLSDTD